MRRGMGFYRRPYTRRPIMMRPVYRPMMRPWGLGWGRRPLWMGGSLLMAFMLFGCLFLAALMFLR